MKVAVFIPAYRHELFIGQSIESVLMQKTGHDLKIFMVDDCSDDGTYVTGLRYSEKYPGRLQVEKNPSNIGSTPNAIRTFELCRQWGDFIAVLSGDDFWLGEDKIELQVNHLIRNPNLSFNFTNAYSFEHPDQSQLKPMLTQNPPEEFDLDYYVYNPLLIPPFTMVIRSECFPEEFPRWMQQAFSFDWGLNFLLLSRGNAGFLGRFTAAYRIHKDSITRKTPFPVNIKNGLHLAKNLDRYFNYRYHSVFGNNLWRFKELVLYYCQTRQWFRAAANFLYCLFSGPAATLGDSYFLKTIYKVIFQGHKVYD